MWGFDNALVYAQLLLLVFKVYIALLYLYTFA